MNGESSRHDKLDNLLQGGSSEPHNVPLEYLRNITNNFSDERLLGEGGFGTVYKGVLQNRETIAVKKLNSMPGVKDKQFENEAGHLMRLEHPNIVLLVGWCSHTENIYVEYKGKYICAEKSERLLCLEYMPKGNLRGYLSDESSGLGWDTRYKIIEGICYDLRYLHEGWKLNAPIVHMDLKPANILLDNNMVPKIADFGLSRLFSEEKTWTYTVSRDGTLGYMSPEYINKGVVSTKSDIFSLGVIILEIVTGRRDYPDDTGTPAEEFIETVLHNWSQGNGVSLEVDYQQIRRCIQIGLDCVKTDRSKRPTISEIIEAFHEPESADSSNIKGVHRRGEISWMERLAKKHTPGFSIYETFTVALHRWQKKTALRRIRVIFATVVFVVLLKRRAMQRFRGRGAVTNFRPLADAYPDDMSWIDHLLRNPPAYLLSSDDNHSSSPTSLSPRATTAAAWEHLFDKRVSPSDVGKLNRLVIPKQHAEKHFPLQLPSAGGESKGMLLNRGVRVKWTSTARTVERGSGGGGYGNPYNMFGRGHGDQRGLELQFPRQHRDLIHDHYIPHLIDEATRMRLKSRERRLYTNRATGPGEDHHRLWTSHTFSHPSTFDTLAIDPALREEIRTDLLRFAARRDHYARVGRAWKRGYLLHGPPGTGKTSLVAAIANLLEFDVYVLELTTVPTNSHLRRLLVSTTPKSVVVVEDIDCSLDLSDRNKKKKKGGLGGAGADNDEDAAAQLAVMSVSPAAAAAMAVMGRVSISLSGVLNFVDGLWLSCVDERLMVFTTNHLERLDPALLRPGRMHIMIQLGYCTPPALRVLAKNYLGVGDEGCEDADEDPDTVNTLVAEAEGLLAATEVQITPADIAEVFMGCDGAGAAAGLRKLVGELQRRRDAAPATAVAPGESTEDTME